MCAHADYREGLRACRAEIRRLLTALAPRWRRLVARWRPGHANPYAPTGLHP